MRIAIVSSGSSIHVKKIANALCNRGHEIELFTLKGHEKLLKDFDRRVMIHVLPIKAPWGYYLNAPKLRRMLNDGHFDLLNSHYASGYGTLASLTKCHPFALAVFGSDVYEYPYKSKWHMKRVIKNFDCADVLTSTSNVMAAEVRKFYHKNRPIYVTPFGVDLNVFHPVDVVKDEGFEFGIVKKIEPKYGIKTLILAYQQFKKRHVTEKTRLVIYGRGSHLEEYKQLVTDEGLSDCVFFKGFIQNENVPQAFAKMHVAVFPSESESFGVAAVEAMGCGTPVIVSDASGFTEVVEDGKTGIIVPKKNVQALVIAMEKMYAMSDDQRSKIGAAGVKRVQCLYDFEENMDTYVAAINHALDK
jgi:glycosyltransferase involved in cell wall biosynthesis